MKTMDIQLGTLNFLPTKDIPELLAKSVEKALINLSDTDKIGVTEIDPSLSDTAAFCEHYQIGMNQAANCVILEAKRGDRIWLAACVILGSNRADVNGLARRTLDARKVSFAPMEQAVEQTGMEYGAITPVGLPANWLILIDKAVANSEYVIIGSGIRKSKLAIPGKVLASLPNAKVLEGLGRERTI
jgi:prolyl-tRNA editing enzyme YbaK/EbsC (Cys-tRNA(Pro) deacylase)